MTAAIPTDGLIHLDVIDGWLLKDCSNLPRERQQMYPLTLPNVSKGAERRDTSGEKERREPEGKRERERALKGPRGCGRFPWVYPGPSVPRNVHVTRARRRSIRTLRTPTPRRYDVSPLYISHTSFVDETDGERPAGPLPLARVRRLLRARAPI